MFVLKGAAYSRRREICRAENRPAVATQIPYTWTLKNGNGRGTVGRSWRRDFSLGQPKPRCERINRSYKVEPEEVEEHYVT